MLGRTPRAPLFLRVGGLVFGFGNDGLDFLARRSTGGIGFVTHHRVGAGPRPALSCAREGDGVNDMGNICEVEPWPGPIMKAWGLYFPSLSWWIFVLSPAAGTPDGVVMRLGPAFPVIRGLPHCCAEGSFRAGGRS